MSTPPANYGRRSRGITSGDVAQAADALLRSKERPTVERIRTRLGSGSPNTIGPMLDEWWGRLAGRLDNGPAAFHRLPESVAHIAEALWLQALEEGRIRAKQELNADTRTAHDQRHAYELRSHVLTLREGEFESRLIDRDKVIALLEQQLNKIKRLVGKERAGREAAERQVDELRNVRVIHQGPDAPRKAVSKRAAASPMPRKAPSKAIGRRKSQAPTLEGKRVALLSITQMLSAQLEAEFDVGHLVRNLVPKMGSWPQSGHLSGSKHCAPHRQRQLGRYKRFLGIHVVFPGFIDHPQLPQLFCPSVRNTDINLPTLQGHLTP